MKLTAGNFLVRANYLATVVFGTMLALFIAVCVLADEVRSSTKDLAATASILSAIVILYVLPGARALRRLATNGTVIPPELVNERPVVAWVVSLAGGAGHFFFLILMSVAIDIALAPAWPDDIGGPLGFVFGLALLSYLVALLCGELALVGDGKSDAARAARPDPFC